MINALTDKLAYFSSQAKVILDASTGLIRSAVQVVGGAEVL